MFTATRRLLNLSSHLRIQPTSTLPTLTQTSSFSSKTRPQVQATTFKLGSSLSTKIDPAKMSEIKQFVDKAIQDNDVVVFSKSYCPVSVWCPMVC